MTKAEIFEMIENTEKKQCEVLKAVNDLVNSVSISNDTSILAAILLTLNNSICSTMNNLAMILCEMLHDDGGMNHDH